MSISWAGSAIAARRPAYPGSISQFPLLPIKPLPSVNVNRRCRTLRRRECVEKKMGKQNGPFIFLLALVAEDWLSSPYCRPPIGGHTRIACVCVSRRNATYFGRHLRVAGVGRPSFPGVRACVCVKLAGAMQRIGDKSLDPSPPDGASKSSKCECFSGKRPPSANSFGGRRGVA